MSKVDELILDYIFDLQTKISDLIDPELRLNRRGHGLSKETLLSKLIELRKKGLLFFLADNSEVTSPICSCLDLQDSWYVSLTEKGGEVWEKTFSPNWKKYVKFDSSFSNGQEVERVVLESGSEETLMNLLNEGESNILLSSEILKITPWKPTYWKTIDKGFSVSIELRDEFYDQFVLKIADIDWRRVPE